ncbi:hypothetical protein V6N11_069054 [Hibiscus sabdariffa]|uniref:Uncharacterized protein n=1 Tax=Hibiscus sabdariffa TaxID=183260 RepID=A0ABR2A135_9ROSI
MLTAFRDAPFNQLKHRRREGAAAAEEEIWKTLRKNFRLGRNVSAPLVPSHSPQLDHAPRHDIIQLTTQNHVSGPTPTVSSHSTVVTQHNQVPRRGIIRLTSQHHVSRPTPVQASGNCIPQNHVSSPSIIRACSLSTRRWISYNPSVGDRHVLNKSTVQPPPVSQEVLGVHNTVMRRDRESKSSCTTGEGPFRFDISWVDYISQNSQQPPDYLQFQTSGSTTGEGPFNINEGDNSYYNELESFLSDNHCTPEGSLTARLNAPSPPDHVFRYWNSFL